MRFPLLVFLAMVAAAAPAADRVVPPPARLKLDPFYAKYVDVFGIPVVAASEVSDAALLEAARIARAMLAPLDPKAVAEMRRHRARIAVIGRDQQTTDVPEYRDLYRLYPGTDWNRRARGLGGTKAIPVTSAGEENLLRLPGDRYVGESILIHELSHTVMDLGVALVDRRFDRELTEAFEHAKKTGLWKDTYALTNRSEYWAEGVQSYFDANLRVHPPNGIHNHVATRLELRQYDPKLYRLIHRTFGGTGWSWRRR
jgi:hypothetical protein